MLPQYCEQSVSSPAFFDAVALVNRLAFLRMTKIGGGGYLIVKRYLIVVLGVLDCGTGRAVHMGGFFSPEFPSYESVFNLNSGRWIAFSQSLSQLKKFEYTLHLQIDKIHRHGYETS